MIVKNFLVRFLTTIFIISSLSTQTRAELTSGYQVSIKFPETDDRGAPARTQPGGRRGSCNLDHLSQKTTPPNSRVSKTELLMAIAPTNNIITSVVGNPAVYIHTLIVDKPVKFSVFESDVDFLIPAPEGRSSSRSGIVPELYTSGEVYTTKFSLTDAVGIVKVKLPETVKLQPNKIYDWYFTVICDPEDEESKTISVQGQLQRRSLTPQQLQKIKGLRQNPIEQAKLYAEYGIWYETLEILEFWPKYPRLKSAWDELLASVKLGQFRNAKVKNCCQFPRVPSTRNINSFGKPKSHNSETPTLPSWLW